MSYKFDDDLTTNCTHFPATRVGTLKGKNTSNKGYPKQQRNLQRYFSRVNSEKA